MGRFPRPLEHWEGSLPVPRKHCNTSDFTRIRMFIRVRCRLWENADYFHAQLRGLGLDTGESTTYVMPIVIGDRERMYRLGHELRRRGLWVAPVDYPAVP